MKKLFTLFLAALALGFTLLAYSAAKEAQQKTLVKPAREKQPKTFVIETKEGKRYAIKKNRNGSIEIEPARGVVSVELPAGFLKRFNKIKAAPSKDKKGVKNEKN